VVAVIIMDTLTQLPPEILHGIFSFVSPADLSVIPQTCRFLYHYVKGNSALCRDVYYHNFVSLTPDSAVVHAFTRSLESDWILLG
jgi:hypothetical protein